MFKFISNHTLKSSAFQNLRNNSVSIPKERITSKILFKSLFNGRILPKNKQIQNVFSNSLLNCKREDCGVIQNVFPDNVTYFEVLGVGNEIDGR